MKYITVMDGITAEMAQGFFVGWPNPPSGETLVKLLRNSYKAIAAIDEEANRVAGFITAFSDGVLSAYIPFLEVRPEYQGKGIGKELTRRMLDELDQFYMVDLLCDKGLQPYYESLGMMKAEGMMIRNFSRQSGE